MTDEERFKHIEECLVALEKSCTLLSKSLGTLILRVHELEESMNEVAAFTGLPVEVEGRNE